MTHEEAAEEPAATTEAGTEGAGTSAETPRPVDIHSTYGYALAST